MTREEFNEKWRNIIIQVDGPIDISIVEAINWITRAKVFYDSKKCRRPSKRGPRAMMMLLVR